MGHLIGVVRFPTALEAAGWRVNLRFGPPMSLVLR